VPIALSFLLYTAVMCVGHKWNTSRWCLWCW